MNTLIHELQSEAIRFRLFDDASAQIVDLKRDRVWTMGATALQQRRWMDEDFCWLQTARHHPEAYVGRFRAEMEGDLARITLYAPFVGGRGGFTVRYSVEGGDLTVEITQIDDEIPCLTFPGPIEADAAVIPQPRGAEIIRDASANRFYHAIEWHRTLPFWGGLLDEEGRTGRTGWIAVIEEGEPNCHVLRKYAKTAPIWIKSLDSWEYDRRITYRFVDGGYVEMAKVFRGWAKRNGMYKSLEEKIEERPRLAGFVGGRNVAFMLSQPVARARWEEHWLDPPVELRDAPDRLEVDFTFTQALDVVKECRKLGMAGGQFKFDGWGQGGYDARHPDIWPPDPAMGTIDEFRALLAQDAPFMTTIHENYNDIYEASPSFPQGVARDRFNEPIPGGVWAGGLAYRTNSRDAYHWAVRNLELTRELGMTGVYIDTLPAWPEESFEPGNECGREESIEYRIRLLRHYQEAGFYTGAEGGKAWNMPTTDWIPANRQTDLPGETPPLFGLVYHDAVFGMTHMGSPGPAGEVTPRMRRRLLEIMLHGWGGTFRGFTRETWPTWKKAFPETLFVDEWHGKVALAEMTNHEYTTPDGLVERTEWSTGQRFTVNFGDEPAEVDGAAIAPLEYRIDE